jgi:hypothetical protein
MAQSKLTLKKRPAEPVLEDEGLSSFAAETQLGETPEPGHSDKPIANSRKIAYAAAGLGALLTVTAGLVAYFATRPTPNQAAVPRPVGMGTAIIDSRPQGAAIFIDGIAHGTTPSKIPVPAGPHMLELKAEGVTRSFELNVEAASTTSHYVELAAPAATPVALVGRLEVASNPSGAQVALDGSAKGRTPLTLNDVHPGEHTVAISNGSETVNRKVSVAAGNTASVFASLGAPDSAAGWVAFKTTATLQIFEGKRLVGTTAAERLMLPAGRHELEFVNTELEFRRSLSVQVGAGTTVNAAVELPSGSLSINALPWADVTIDGRSIGTTPLGNLAVPIGSHEIVWRHPQLGERRRTVAVPATTPVRVGVDLNQ